MKPATLGAFLLVWFAGCAPSPHAEPEPDPSIEDTYVYLEAVKPETVRSVRFREPLRYDVVNERFIYMDVKTGRYLLEMERDCGHLESAELFTDMADRRSMRGRIRAQIDTVRGCRIATIYVLPPLPEPLDEPEGQSLSERQEDDRASVNE